MRTAFTAIRLLVVLCVSTALLSAAVTHDNVGEYSYHAVRQHTITPPTGPSAPGAPLHRRSFTRPYFTPTRVTLTETDEASTEAESKSPTGDPHHGGRWLSPAAASAAARRAADSLRRAGYSVDFAERHAHHGALSAAEAASSAERAAKRIATAPAFVVPPSVAPAHGNAAAVFSKPPPPVALPPLLPLATLDATAQAAESAAGATHGADGFALSAYPRQREIGTEAAPAGYYNYGILIDAGSTGSRAYLYRWHPRQRTLYSSLSLPSAAPRRPFSRPATLPGWSVKTTPGLSDYAAAPARAVEAVRPLVEYALSVLKELGVEDKVPETPVYLKATGGMRGLPTAAADAVMAAVSSYLSNTGLRFNPRTYAKIISGEEEGVFGWLTVNYLLSNQTLFWQEAAAGPAPGTAPGSSPDPLWGLDDDGHSSHTAAALDLGGASMQLTFRPPSGTNLLAHHYPLQLAYTRNSLYVECFWYYGKDAALWRVHNVLFARSFPEAFGLPRGYYDMQPEQQRAALAALEAESRADAAADGTGTAGANAPAAAEAPAATEARAVYLTSAAAAAGIAAETTAAVQASVAAEATAGVGVPRARSRVHPPVPHQWSLPVRSARADHSRHDDATDVAEAVGAGAAADAHASKSSGAHPQREGHRLWHRAVGTATGSGSDSDPVFRSPCLPTGYEAAYAPGRLPRLGPGPRGYAGLHGHTSDERRRSHAADAGEPLVRMSRAGDASKGESARGVDDDGSTANRIATAAASRAADAEGDVIGRPTAAGRVRAHEAAERGQTAQDVTREQERRRAAAASGASAADDDDFEDEDFEVVVEGAADWDQCYGLATELIHTRLTGPCHSATTSLSSPYPGQCTSFFGLYRPALENIRTFYAFSGFSYFPNFVGLHGEVTLQAVADAGRAFCARPWSELRAAYPDANAYYLRSYCWLAVYSVAVLHEGLGIPMNPAANTTKTSKSSSPSSNSTGPTLHFVRSIAGTDVTFALGAMVHDVNLLPWSISQDWLARAEHQRALDVLAATTGASAAAGPHVKAAAARRAALAAVGRLDLAALVAAQSDADDGARNADAEATLVELSRLALAATKLQSAADAGLARVALSEMGGDDLDGDDKPTPLTEAQARADHYWRLFVGAALTGVAAWAITIAGIIVYARNASSARAAAAVGAVAAADVETDRQPLLRACNDCVSESPGAYPLHTPATGLLMQLLSRVGSRGSSAGAPPTLRVSSSADADEDDEQAVEGRDAAYVGAQERVSLLPRKSETSSVYGSRG